MNVTVVHGFSKIPLHFDNSTDMTVNDVMVQLSETTGVPVPGQKLIYKGKTLTSDQRLDSLGLKSGSKLMLIGKKFNPEEDATFKRLDELLSQNQQMRANLDNLVEDVRTLGDGFLSKDILPTRLGQLKKDALGLGEKGMELLESIDSIQLQSYDEDDATKSRLKNKRKTTVASVQKLVDDADALVGKIDEMNGSQ